MKNILDEDLRSISARATYNEFASSMHKRTESQKISTREQLVIRQSHEGRCSSSRRSSTTLQAVRTFCGEEGRRDLIGSLPDLGWDIPRRACQRAARGSPVTTRGNLSELPLLLC